MGECSETSRDAIGGSDWDRIMRGRPHAQERANALIKSGVQMMRQSVRGQDGSHTNGTGQVQMGDVGPSARETLQLRRRTQGHCEGLGLVTATGILGTRNPAACSSVRSLCSGLWCIF
ncbi:hypothetical protein TNIN_74291 [Trichonephila inaurata madagascariensis]|uniref:Uncharacterized protein n=1 Tax=Trichonephila inaurata madagascariensis TaxID=2747483 RepID=A0A8X6YG31_9ARAC|nr:hypothetical protein TNIN_74291 [Trichonephila inaurata madagascariensis]